MFPKKTNGLILLATAAISFAMFAVTYFAMAENNNSSNLFLDSDQDGLTDQEEKMIGTDPMSSDTDGDGYSDGKEVESGFNPLKPAPGDKLMPNESISAVPKTSASSPSIDSTQSSSDKTGTGSDSTNLLDSLNTNAIDSQTLDAMSADPNNLTNQVVNNFLETTLSKSQSDSNFTSNPSYSDDDLNQIVQSSLGSSDISTSLPEISDSEIKVLPEVSGKKLSDDEIKAKEKEQVQTYLSSIAYIFATNSPFSVDDPSNLTSNLEKEQSATLTALMSGDQTKIDDYAEKAQNAINQIKQVEVPYIMKDFHKSALQLAIYTLDFKDKVAVDPKDPVKNLAALGSLQAVSESATKLQDQLSAVLQNYGIDTIKPVK